MMTWQPLWWNETTMSAWDRVKEALRRDWEQTKHDLGIAGGHELNQTATDTVAQAVNEEMIPMNDGPNPPTVIGDWDDVELPLRYGYGARQKYGSEHPIWNEGLDQKLRAEWEANIDPARPAWHGARKLVRYGYDYSLTPKPAGHT
jgi:hypothetical protein